MKVNLQNKKKLYAWLKTIANDLPLQGYKTKELHLVSGCEANELTEGTDANIFGDRFKPCGIYKRKYPVINTVNHLNRLKKAYKNNGLQGVSDYIENVKISVLSAKK